MTEHEKFEKEKKDYQNKIRLAIEASKDERKTTDFKNLNPDNICLLLAVTNNFTDNKSVSDNEITGGLAKDFLIDKDSLDSALSEIKKRQPKKNFYKTINLKGLYDYLNDSVYCVKKEQGSYSNFADRLTDEHYEKYNLTRFDDEFDKDDDFSVYKEYEINALSFLASEGFIQRIEKINTELVSGEKTEDYALVNDDGYVYARDNFYIVELFKENATGRSYYISLSKSIEEQEKRHFASLSPQIFALRKQEAEKFIADTDIQIEKPLFLNSNEPQKNIYISGKITGVENWNSPSLKQSFNPYKVWDRTDENEQVFKDWFEENKKNLTEKDLTNFNLSSVFSLANYLEEDYKFKVPEFGTALGSQGMAKVLMPFVEESKTRNPNKTPKEQSSIKKTSEPQKKGIGYKVFYLTNGKLYPPMVQNPNGEATPMNSWIEASAGEVAGKTTTGRPQVKKGGRGTHSSPGLLAYRPGWHLGDVPIARQFSKKNPENGLKELFPAEFVWAECEYAADVDYQKEAMANGYTENGAFRHSYAGLQKFPENGSYRYRTNPDSNTEEWIITGKIKVNRILSNDEVDELCRKAGKEPQKREPGSFGEVEKEFIKKLSSEFSKTKSIEESFSNAIKNFTTVDIAKYDSLVKVKLGEKYSRSDLMKYLEEIVTSQDKIREKNNSDSYERGL